MSHLLAFPRLPLLTACLLGLALPAPPALAAMGPHPHRQIKQQIDELEQQWKTATLTSDSVAMERLLSDDYLGISWTGQVNTKSTQLDRIRLKTFMLNQMEVSDVKIKLLGPVAIVTARAQIAGTNDGVPMQGDFRYTRVYQRLPSGAWKITNFEATRIPTGPHNHRHPDPAGP